MKRCTKCNEDLPVEAFGPRAAGRDGLQAQCRVCMAARVRARRQRDPLARSREREYERRPEVRRRNRAYRAARRLGITVAEYEMIDAIQGGRCAVCNREHPKLFLDHDHATGAVRGLLCPPCNIALGQAQDDPDRLRALADYVEDHRAIASLTEAQWQEVLR